MNSDTAKAARKTWSRTKIPQLYRHKSQTYYGRYSVGGKETWRSLGTKVLSVAKEELEERLKDAARLKELGVDAAVGERMTGADVINIHKTALANDPSIKPSTVHYWNQIIAFLENSWPEFLVTEMRHMNQEQCQAWAGKIRSAMSPTRFNNAIGALKKLFSIAVKRGAKRTNPAEDLKRMKVRRKDLSQKLPSAKQFKELVQTVREGGGRFSKECANLVEFLAYTGVRTGEAKWIRWKHCDFTPGAEEILIVGHPEQGTKNGEFRRVPMNPATRDLLERIKQQRPVVHQDDAVLNVREAQKAMDRAFETLGMKRFTHHDLRHYFATTCIESGTDIPSVAKWLGHKDGGVLAMKVYGHLRNEHSFAAASRVSFAP